MSELESGKPRRKTNISLPSFCLALSLGLASLGSFGLSAQAEKTASIKGSSMAPGIRPEYSQADAGIKLLMGIFSRLGSEPQLALKNELRSQEAVVAQATKEAQFAAASSNNTDPALAIRPQSSRRLTVGRAVMNKTIPVEPVTIAMAKKADNRFVPSSSPTAADEGTSSFSAANLKDQNANAGAALDQINIPILAAQPESDAKARQKGQLQGISYLAGSTTSNIIPNQDKTHLRELSQGDDARARVEAKRKDRDYSNARDKEEESEQNYNGIIRPTEQPGLFKYVREHAKDLPKEAPAAPAPAAESAREKADGLVAPPPPIVASSKSVRGSLQMAQADWYKSKKESYNYAVQAGSAGSRGAAYGVAAGDALGTQQSSSLRWNYGAIGKKPLKQTIAAKPMANAISPAPVIAFLPPSTIRGITGLPLGSSDTETAAFFKGKGQVKATTSQGWKVYTLTDKYGATSLQAYLRNGRVEAMRVFSRQFIPVNLGVSIEDELSNMKSKFGEPSFILDEPKSTQLIATMPAKNYIYPLSQVGFQLARPQGGGAPRVLSVLLFKYL